LTAVPWVICAGSSPFKTKVTLEVVFWLVSKN
jgi:hypothetical protein